MERRVTAASPRAPATEASQLVTAALGQARERWPLLLLLYGLVGTAFLAALVVRFTSDVTVAELTRDPLQYLEAPVYTGIIAVTAGLLWAGVTGACLLGALLLRGRDAEGAAFLGWAAVVTAVLAVDDVFMLHDVVFQDAGIDERIVYGVYLVAVAAFLWRFRATILRQDFLLLGLALAAFAASLFVDATDDMIRYPQSYIWEDGAKVAGIVTWGAFFVLATLRLARSVHQVEGPPGVEAAR